jgi:uncharacterized protein (TIGR02598 family)
MKTQSHNWLNAKSLGGFTLPEVSLAAAVCMIGMVGVLALLPAALENGRDASDRTLAAQIAADEISQYRAAAAVASSFPPSVNRLPWGTTGNTANHYYDINGSPIQSATDPSRYFQVLVSLSTHSNAGAPMFPRSVGVDLIVRIQWPMKHSGWHTKYTDYFVTTIARQERP